MPLIELSDAVKVVDGYKRRNPDSWSLCNSIRCDIGELPTLSPDEVRGVGEWISDFDGCSIEFYKDGFVGGSCHCSKCGDHLDGSAEYAVKGKYCPSCGAKMEVSEDTRKN